MDNHTESWLALACLRLSARQLSSLRSIEPNLSVCFESEKAQRSLLSSIGYNFDAYRPMKERLSEAQAIYRWAMKAGWSLITQACASYPKLLIEIPDPPLVLFVKGDRSKLSAPQVAVVGSRQCSAQGEATAKRFANELSVAGISVTSGLALGIDRAAHLGGLAGSGSTLAVLATGPDRVYPRRNQALCEDISTLGGLVVTEKLPGTVPKPYLFPERNRLISGLSLGVLVVEAVQKSGSLITAKMALEQGREVMAIPGSLANPRVRGCHQLIKQGAGLIETSQDIIKLLYEPLKSASLITESSDSSSSRAYPAGFESLLSILESSALSLDQIQAKSGIEVSELSVQLSELELDGWLVTEGAKYVKLR